MIHVLAFSEKDDDIEPVATSDLTNAKTKKKVHGTQHTVNNRITCDNGAFIRLLCQVGFLAITV